MAIYIFTLSAGVGGGIVISGLITIAHGWRMIYWVATALIGACNLFVIFAFPETAYPRNDPLFDSHATTIPVTKETISTTKRYDFEKTEVGGLGAGMEPPRKHSYIQNLNLFSQKYTEEYVFKLFF